LILAAALIIKAIPLLRMLPGRGCNDKDGRQISILKCNTEFQHNNHYELLQQLINARNPDVIALVEINQKWIDAIAPSTIMAITNALKNSP
jgi:hypothetical protein